ncbi:MAG: ATP-binding cassette domain-containing protein, partial [Mycobacteriaceae bacterium]|nr:ATP-binding cassette domain-containing protein [Mycobacteriaceae bacterium]
FAPGHDVVIGRDLRADVRVAHPLVSRAHVVLRYDRGRWVAIDNGSLNGMFVDHRRVPAVDIRDGGHINIGNPDGPRLTFEVGRHTGSVGRPPTSAVRIAQPSSSTWQTSAPARQYPSGPQSVPQPRTYPTSHPTSHPASHPVSPPSSSVSPPSSSVSPPSTSVSPPSSSVWPPSSSVSPPSTSHPTSQPVSPQPSVYQPTTQIGPSPGGKSEVTNLATSMIRILRPGAGAAPPPGSITIGRANDNDIVIPDVLASRHHATLVPTDTGVEIQDAGSINGTFVNGSRVKDALLTDGDVVTIGNVDLMFQGGTLVRRTETEAATRTGGLEVRGITLEIDHGRRLLESISFAARPGTLTAVIGPSGAGKSTLARVIVGATQPTQGTVSFEGHNIHAEYASLRSRIGMVPQDDVVHSQLTVTQALNYAAELRLPPDTTKEDRRQVISQVLEELELTQHAEKRVDKLSGGQRKRASVAMELLTGPSLLILDEPTSGLDPALDRQVMTMLRQLADAGRVVVVVTHSLTYLDVCDQVLLLAPGGKTAFCGPPGEIGRAMGTTNWADIFTKVGADPDAVHRRFLERAAPPPAPAETEKPTDLGKPVHTSLWRQFSTVSRRQVRLIVSDRGYFVFLALLPFIMGVLSLAVPGNVGFGIPNPMGDAPNEPGQILVLLNVGAIFMGTALTIRALIGERAIFLREQAVGLSTTAYLLAKIVVFTVFAVVQSAIVVAITVGGKGAPTQGAVLLKNPALELFVDIAVTCVTAAMVGLALSALARSHEQIMPLLVVAIMSQLVFSGGMIPVTDRIGLDQLSWFTPARWGFAASASTADLTKLVPGPLTPKDSHWQHTTKAWLFDMAMLAVLCICYGGFVRWKIRLKGG